MTTVDLHTAVKQTHRVLYIEYILRDCDYVCFIYFSLSSFFQIENIWNGYVQF
jgi:hypothetical protein